MTRLESGKRGSGIQTSKVPLPRLKSVGTVRTQNQNQNP
jgi:hypothetical protein